MDNEKVRYTIGEVAKLMGIQAQLLRYYCEIGLVTPEYIDPNTGYRYFSFDQFPDIDRTRFLLRCGLKLKDIKAVLKNDDIGLLIKLLNAQKKTAQDELAEIYDNIRTIDWYISYFSYNTTQQGAPCRVEHVPKRYFLAVKCPEGYQPTEFYRLFQSVKNQERYRGIRLTRQVSVILDYDALLHKKFIRYYVGRFTMDDPGFCSEHILEIPAGECYSFCADIYSDDWNPEELSISFAGREKPTLVLANEFEKSFSNYNRNPFQLQIFFDDVHAII